MDTSRTEPAGAELDAEALAQIRNARGETALDPVVNKPPLPNAKKRSGYTTAKGKPRNQVRARMAKTSRVRNRH